MNTIHLKFADRAEALAALAALLGYGPQQDGTGQWWPTTGTAGGIRYDLCFLADQGVTTGSDGDHVNLLWWGDAAGAPDFGAHVVMPQTPSAVFAV
ncbi:hypothetical protein [Xanthobacter sediminis]|uniref:hypothetical protein n=1 Tax=Xanthobacter sediminis TaxID=3119926 RepID=UPI00372A1BBE